MGTVRYSKRAYRVACPVCRADAGEVCVSLLHNSPHPMLSVHSERADILVKPCYCETLPTENRPCGMCRRRIANTIRNQSSIRATNRKIAGHAAMTHQFNKTRHRAREKNLKFDLTFDEFKQKVQQDCFYCGCSPEIRGDTGRLEGCIAHGLDRVNNVRGYSFDNVVACCHDCNRAKGALSQDQFAHLILLWWLRFRGWWQIKNAYSEEEANKLHNTSLSSRG